MLVLSNMAWVGEELAQDIVGIGLELDWEVLPEMSVETAWYSGEQLQLSSLGTPP